MNEINEVIKYLRDQIDPLDQLNPKYNMIHDHIDKLTRAQADLYCMQVPSFKFRNGQLEIVDWQSISDFKNKQRCEPCGSQYDGSKSMGPIC